jgi:adenylate cyclase
VTAPLPLRKRLVRIVAQAGMMRLAATALFLVLALLIARFSWQLPLVSDAERALYDIRLMLTTPHVDQDDRILMVVYTDETLEKTRKRSPLDRKILADALTAIDTMGAKSIAIDIIIDQPQPEDQALVDAFRALRTPTYLAYASNRTNERFIKLWQEEFLADFQRRIATSVVRPTSILLETDADRVVRRWPVQPASLPPLLSGSVSGSDAFDRYRGGIRFRLPVAEDRPVFASLPIDLFADPATAALMRSQVAGRHVLIGGDLLDIDQFETPMKRVTGETTIGLEVHAHMLAQLLDRAAYAPFARWAVAAMAVIVVLAGALSSLSDARPWKIGLLLAVQLVLFISLPFLLQARGVDTLELPAFGWGAGWLLAYAAVGTAARAIGSEQRRFAQSALGKYLPRDIASEILRDPDRLALHGEKREIFVVFSDLEGFTKLSHAIAPEMVATLLNRYLDMLSAVVLAHGGTIDKFVGDAVVAFWGAPIARPDDGERAARAALAMAQAGEQFRQTTPADVPPIGRTRVGLHFGEAIVGNFGGEGRIQYTALGDSMNTAARLEAANKGLETVALASREAVERSGLDWFRPMGRVILRGRATPVEIFEPAPHVPRDQRDATASLLARFDAGDAAALDELEKMVKMNVDDAGLANLVYRLRHIEAGGSFVLG